MNVIQYMKQVDHVEVTHQGRSDRQFVKSPGESEFIALRADKISHIREAKGKGISGSYVYYEGVIGGPILIEELFHEAVLVWCGALQESLFQTPEPMKVYPGEQEQ